MLTEQNVKFSSFYIPIYFGLYLPLHKQRRLHYSYKNPQITQ